MDVERIIRLSDPKERKQVEDFLARFDLSFEDQVDYTVALYRDDQMIGTGSLKGSVLRNVAIDETIQGEGLLAKIISLLVAEGARQGIFSFQLFTKPEKVKFFEWAGFRKVAVAEPWAALLEIGIGGVNAFCETVKDQVSPTECKRSALVMNCNPFTLGHQKLVEYASLNSEEVVLFVVEENESVFPFEDRIELVRKGTAHLPNVKVVPSGKYIISSATFPTYFVKGKDALEAQTLLDVNVFAERIAPSLGICKRFIGEEPTDGTTQAYNEALKKVLPTQGIEVEVIPRFQVDKEVISASKVRRAITEGDFDSIKSCVPYCTYEYLGSEKGIVICERLQKK